MVYVWRLMERVFLLLKKKRWYVISSNGAGDGVKVSCSDDKEYIKTVQV